MDRRRRCRVKFQNSVESESRQHCQRGAAALLHDERQCDVSHASHDEQWCEVTAAMASGHGACDCDASAHVWATDRRCDGRAVNESATCGVTTTDESAGVPIHADARTYSDRRCYTWGSNDTHAHCACDTLNRAHRVATAGCRPRLHEIG